MAGARARSPNKVTSLSDVVGWGAEGQSGSSLCFTLCSCWCRRADDNESKAVLDAFFLGKAFAEALTERVESVVGEVFSVVGQWQAEQQKQVQDFQEEVVQRAQKAKEKAATEVSDDKGAKSLREPSATIVTTTTMPSPPATPTQTE